jgi:hypothetical protein
LKDEIFKGEYAKDKMNENQIIVLMYAYILLNNVLVLIERYLNNKTVIPHFNLKKYFNTFKKLKYIYKSTLTEMDKKEYLEFYNQLIENKQNYQSCIELLKNYQQVVKNESIPIDENHFEKQFCSNLTEDKLNNLQTEYIDNYYETQVNIKKRVYKTENAGVNWSVDDTKKFDDGMLLYGHCQLANNKIAKYMGSHIEVSHVKILRGKISKEKRIRKKQEKDIKISEMKKKKNLNWKIMTDLNEH